MSRVEQPSRRRVVTLGALLAGGALLVLAARLVIAHLVLTFGVDRDVGITLRAKVPVDVSFERSVDVGFSQPLASQIVLRDPIRFSMDHALQVPIDLQVDVPIDTDVFVDQTIHVSLQAPIDVVLTERELSLDRLTLPIDTSVLVDDEIPIDLVVPIDTSVSSVLGLSVPVKANLPIHVKIPIKQRVHIKDTLDVAVSHLRAPLHLVVPIVADLPIKQGIHVTGQVHVPIHRTVPVRFDRVSIQPAPEPIPVTVTLPDKVPVQLSTAIAPVVNLSGEVPVTLGPVRIKAGDVSLGVE
jgi:hypothetical protein